MEFKVGDRIRVFEVLEAGNYYWSPSCGNILGKQVAEIYPNSPNKFCPSVFIKTKCGVRINLAPNLKQSKHVATMVITKLKATTI